jgi:hypothetical protein
MKATRLWTGRPDPIKTWRLACFGVAWFSLAWAALDIRMMFIFNIPLFPDAMVFWSAWHGPMYYSGASLQFTTFIYSPVAALAFWPLAQLPQTAYLVVWTALGMASYVWLLAPLPRAARFPALAAGFLFCVNGNIEWVLALVAVVGMRWPAVWLVALFTKVAPFMGFGWFVLRGEWRSVALTATLAVALMVASALILPGAWPTWIDTVRSLATESAGKATYNSLMPPIPLVVRVAVAAVVLVWGARANRPVVLPLVLALVQPDWQPWALGILAAVPRLVSLPAQVDRDDRVTAQPPASGSLVPGS